MKSKIHDPSLSEQAKQFQKKKNIFMSKTTDKERWMEKVLASAEGILPVSPPRDLNENIIAKLDQPATEIGLSAKSKWIAAAAIALLMTFNFLTYRLYIKQNNVETNSAVFFDEYQLVSFNADI